MKPVLAATFLAASIATLPGCGILQKGDTNSASSTTVPYTQLARPIGIVDGTAGESEAFPDPGVLLINHPADLPGYNTSPLANLDVNFDNQSIIVLALGQQPTGGYWASIDALQLEGADLVVQGRANRPGDGQMVSQVISHPFSAVVVPKLQNVTLLSDIDAVIGEPRPE
ncbi:MAG: protease complex subunit PrcB family protein [Phycisphaeraceae bacterium]